MKFGSVLAEAAYLVALDGFAREFGSVQDGGWNGMADVSGSVLLNVGADEDVRARYLAEHGAREPQGLTVWIREDSQGFVDVVEYGADDGPRSGTDLVVRAFDDAEAHYEKVWHGVEL